MIKKTFLSYHGNCSFTEVLIASDCKQVIQDINNGIGGGVYARIIREIILG
jgi:hypothetical protein